MNGGNPLEEQEAQGWICLWRQLLKSEVWKIGQLGDKNLLFLFIWCLLKAAHAPHEVNKIIVERGQFFTGQHVASKELGITGIMFRRKLKVLKDLGMVTTKVVNRFTLISVCQYSSYQNPELPQPVNRPQHNNGITTNTTVLAESPVVKRKTVAKPREETKPLIVYYSNKYKEIIGGPYHISWAKDSSCIKRLLDTNFTATTLFKLIDMFLNDKDSFLTKTGHTIPMFASRINRYVEQLNTEAKIPSEPFDSRHIPENELEEQEAHRKDLVDRFERKFGGKENIPDDWWRLIYPNDATNPHRKH